ncbi:hypothetical protein [Deinococcus arcticus]|nr:hypothetical protein [Deinococcus arcticus]
MSPDEPESGKPLTTREIALLIGSFALTALGAGLVVLLLTLLFI